MKMRCLMAILISFGMGNLFAEQLEGTIGASAQWGSGWIQFDTAKNFHTGDLINLKIGGSAGKILVRFLKKGDDPSTQNGIIGDAIDVPESRLVQIRIENDVPNIIQISVHGNANPWNIPLGENNGPATLLYAERKAQNDGADVDSSQLTTGCKYLEGTIGHSDHWGSGWIVFDAPRDFKTGETIQVKVGGTATKILFRMLKDGSDPGSSRGIVGDAKEVPDGGLLTISLTQDYSNINQISVHGGEKPWGIWDLGENNGPATILYVKECPPAR